MNNPAPRCPYCGAEMEARNIGSKYYTCPVCYACSPVVHTPEAAYAAAMKRWQEPNRVLTADDLREMEGDPHAP